MTGPKNTRRIQMINIEYEINKTLYEKMAEESTSSEIESALKFFDEWKNLPPRVMILFGCMVKMRQALEWN